MWLYTCMHATLIKLNSQLAINYYISHDQKLRGMTNACQVAS